MATHFLRSIFLYSQTSRSACKNGYARKESLCSLGSNQHIPQVSQLFVNELISFSEESMRKSDFLIDDVFPTGVLPVCVQKCGIKALHEGLKFDGRLSLFIQLQVFGRKIKHLVSRRRLLQLTSVMNRIVNSYKPVQVNCFRALFNRGHITKIYVITLTSYGIRKQRRELIRTQANTSNQSELEASTSNLSYDCFWCRFSLVEKLA